jgi:hypothetical protein
LLFIPRTAYAFSSDRVWTNVTPTWRSGWERSSPARAVRDSRARLLVKCAPRVHAVCTCEVERKALTFLKYSACTTQRAHLFVSTGRCVRALSVTLAIVCSPLRSVLALGTKGPNNWNTLGQTMARASILNGFVCWYCLTFGHCLGIAVSDTAIRWHATPTRSNMTHSRWRAIATYFNYKLLINK